MQYSAFALGKHVQVITLPRDEGATDAQLMVHEICLDKVLYALQMVPD